MGRPLFRVEPKMPAQHMQTFKVTAPISTHRRPATCEEVDCAHQRDGWKMIIDQSTDLGRQQAYYIKELSGRHYKATRLEDGRFELIFTAGQKCFAQHTVSLEREANYLVKRGDYRLPGGTVRRHTRAEDWVEEFSEHQDKLKTIIEKG